MEKIKGEFARLGMQPTYLEHEPVITSEDASRTRGIPLKQGIKAILFTGKEGQWVVADVPADKMVDRKRVAAQLGWSKGATRLATPEEVVSVTGCEIGSVPPFGHKTEVPILVDVRVFDNEVSTFNIGLRTHSVKIATSEMRRLFREIGATEGDFAM